MNQPPACSFKVKEIGNNGIFLEWPILLFHKGGI